MENRNGLVVDTRLTQAMGTAEREAATEMATPPANKQVPSMAGPHSTQDTRLVSERGFASKKSLAGPRQLVFCGE